MIGEVYGDLLFFWGVDWQNGELSFMEIVLKVFSINILLVFLNELVICYEVVCWYLGVLIDGNIEWMLIDLDCCFMFIGGFVVYYKLIKQVSVGEINVFVVVKNMYLYLYDVKQYVCFGYCGWFGVIEDVVCFGWLDNVVGLYWNCQEIRRFCDCMNDIKLF